MCSVRMGMQRNLCSRKWISIIFRTTGLLSSMLATSTYQIFGVCWLGRRLKSGQKKIVPDVIQILKFKKDGFSQHNG